MPHGPTSISADPTPPLHLPEALDLTRADALHGALQTRIAQDGLLRIDGSAVSQVSTACMQVLVAAAVTVRGRGRTFALVSPSSVLRDAAGDLGLAAVLGLEAA
jgi:chemotaxis protein CheX